MTLQAMGGVESCIRHWVSEVDARASHAGGATRDDDAKVPRKFWHAVRCYALRVMCQRTCETCWPGSNRTLGWTHLDRTIVMGTTRSFRRSRARLSGVLLVGPSTFDVREYLRASCIYRPPALVRKMKHDRRQYARGRTTISAVKSYDVESRTRGRRRRHHRQHYTTSSSTVYLSQDGGVGRHGGRGPGD